MNVPYWAAAARRHRTGQVQGQLDGRRRGRGDGRWRTGRPPRRRHRPAADRRRWRGHRCGAAGGRSHQREGSGRRSAGRSVDAVYAVLDGVAYLETAQACGLGHLPGPDRHTARVATTFGVGELILSALDAGHRRMVLGLGGSASTYGGAGMATALGARLLDGAGEPVAAGGAALAALDRIDVTGLDRRVAETEFVIASDVTSPLLGPTGSAALYGPQKGAAPEDVQLLDAALARYAAIVLRDLGVDVAAVPSAGAAGGLAAGTVAFLGARVDSGIDLVMDLLGLAKEVEHADLVLVGRAACGIPRASRARARSGWLASLVTGACPFSPSPARSASRRRS